MAHKFYFQMVQLQMGRKIVPAVGKLRNNPAEFSISEGGSFLLLLEWGGGEGKRGGGTNNFILLDQYLYLNYESDL
jgi:hypothetical protein